MKSTGGGFHVVRRVRKWDGEYSVVASSARASEITRVGAHLVAQVKGKALPAALDIFRPSSRARHWSHTHFLGCPWSWRAVSDFVSPPRDEPYGRLAVFQDLEGNRWTFLGETRGVKRVLTVVCSWCRPFGWKSVTVIVTEHLGIDGTA